MADELGKRLADTNAVLMGHGVGVAALEAMFNLVNSQSVLSASMIRDHELSHPIQMQALAQALSQLLASSEMMHAQSNLTRAKMNAAPAVPVDIPAAPVKPAASPSGQDSVDLGAVSNLSALDGIKKGPGGDGSGEGQQSSLNLDSLSSQTGMSSEAIQQLLMQFMDMASKHMANVIESTRPHLEVT